MKSGLYSLKKIDYYVRYLSLNILEQQTALRIISQLSADKVILDGKTLFAPILNRYVQAVNKADQSYVSVAAASILAKDKRDQLFETLCERYNSDFGEVKGGGYANNQTLKFVKWYREAMGSLPDFYRHSYRWKYLE